jgi:hypothetical protein
VSTILTTKDRVELERAAILARGQLEEVVGSVASHHPTAPYVLGGTTSDH